jgi:hypothetical protein
MSATFEMWRCTGCGRWSHAERRPDAHQRTERDEEKGVSYAVWCGPFERFVAIINDPKPPPTQSPRIGQRVPDSERFIGEDPNAGISPLHEHDGRL